MMQSVPAVRSLTQNTSLRIAYPEGRSFFGFVYRYLRRCYFALNAKIAAAILRGLSFIHRRIPSTIMVNPSECMRMRSVMAMTARERVLSIRLLEKQEKHPEYLRKLGVSVSVNKVESTIINMNEEGKRIV